jgi:hypothetical protein
MLKYPHMFEYMSNIDLFEYMSNIDLKERFEALAIAQIAKMLDLHQPGSKVACAAGWGRLGFAPRQAAGRSFG